MTQQTKKKVQVDCKISWCRQKAYQIQFVDQIEPGFLCSKHYRLVPNRLRLKFWKELKAARKSGSRAGSDTAASQCVEYVEKVYGHVKR